MKELPRVGFVCSGESALELSGAICCAGRLMRYFNDNGYMTGGCYSCISPSKQARQFRERLGHMCACNDVVVTVGCNGFRGCDIVPDVVLAMCSSELPYFSCCLSSDEYTDAETRKKHSCFPSRGVAGLYSASLVLCVSADLPSTLGKISSIMKSLTFAVGNKSKKMPAASMELEDLVSDFYRERSFQD